MSANSKHTAAAGQYAQAVLDLANNTGDAETIGRELSDLRKLMDDNGSFGLFLRDPAVSKTERQQAIERIFRGKVSPLLFNTLGVLNNKGRLGLIPELAEEYRKLLDVQLGNLHVQVTVAQPLDAAEMENVRSQISSAFKMNAVLEQKVDDRIIGGMVLRLGDRLIDASVRSQLEAMKHKLMSAAPAGRV